MAGRWFLYRAPDDPVQLSRQPLKNLIYWSEAAAPATGTPRRIAINFDEEQIS